MSARNLRHCAATLREGLLGDYDDEIKEEWLSQAEQLLRQGADAIDELEAMRKKIEAILVSLQHPSLDLSFVKFRLDASGKAWRCETRCVLPCGHAGKCGVE